MPAFLTTARTRVSEKWNETTTGQRVVAGLLALAIVLMGVFGVMALARPTMAPVFSNLSPEDAAAVVEQLDSAGIPYELTAGGATVLVPEDQVYAQRIALASAGIPTSSDGYALLDDMAVTSSDFQQQVTYQRAVEGELARTIAAMSDVNDATVHLAIPKESVFTEEQQPTTASVFLDLSPTAEMDAANVQGVVNLVSSSVPGLKPQDVSVVDAKGNVLTGGAGGAGGAVKSEYEDSVRANIQTMLDRVLGPGNSAVSVQADLTQGTTERTSETFTPAEEGTPALNESTSREVYEGGGGAATGILGPDNIAVPNTTQADAGGGYESTDEVRNNAVNKVTEQTTTAPGGGVARQSVSVVVDSQAAAVADVNQLTAMVSTAAGIDAERGDQVNVTAMAFDQSAAQEAEEALAEQEAAARAEQQRDLLIMAVIALIVLVVLFLVWRAVRRARMESREEIDLTELRLVEEDDYEEIDALEELAALPPAAPAEPEITAAMEARNALADMAESEPAEIASKLRDWMVVRR